MRYNNRPGVEKPLDFLATINFVDTIVDVEERLKAYPGAFIICDKIIAPTFQSLLSHKPKLFLSVDGGEQIKSWRSIQFLINQLLRHNINRQDYVIAIGGGAIGDAVGFAASIVKRGVPWVNVPTTLLAQVDSSIGGKTAINSSYGKNLIGSFYPAVETLICQEFLQTLPQRQLAAGMAEVIKMAVIADPAFYHELEHASLMTMDWGWLIKKAVQLKLQIIGDDFFEEMDDNGTRQLLNLGHTFGHAFEWIHPHYLHGEAVALGLLAEASFAELIGKASGLVGNLNTILKNYDLPTDYKGCIPDSFTRLFKYLSRDKKNTDSFIQFILPQQIGKVTKVRVSKPELKNFYSLTLRGD